MLYSSFRNISWIDLLLIRLCVFSVKTKFWNVFFYSLLNYIISFYFFVFFVIVIYGYVFSSMENEDLLFSLISVCCHCDINTVRSKPFLVFTGMLVVFYVFL